MRRVRVTTASVLVDEETFCPSPCIERCLARIDQAGRDGADLVLLPEEPDVVGCPT